jgi:predicted transcriptional regulator
MQLNEMMDSRIGTVSANDYALEALRHMKAQKLDWSFVLDRNQVSGVVFARDLARLSETTLKEKDVREYLTTNLVIVDIETEPQEAARLLRHSGRGFVGVVKGNQPVGMLTSESLAHPSRHRVKLQAS